MTDQADVELQIREYEDQLADVDELLRASPDDPSLVTLKSDLLELLKITRQSIPSNNVHALGAATETISYTSAASFGNVFEKALEAAVGNSVGMEMNAENTVHKRSANDETLGMSFANVMTEAAVAATAGATNKAENEYGGGADTDNYGASNEPAKKKTKKIKDFEVPSHLIPNDGDSEAERNKKRRAIKALKSKWREKKKEIESDKKQQSWQSFQKKTKIDKGRSMFATYDGNGDATVAATKVGVVSATSGRQMTEFGERKRHK